MTLTKLQLTQFQVQKLQCIGGEGRAAPYRITTFRGMEVGSFGTIRESELVAANAPSFKVLHRGLIPQALERLLGRSGRRA